MAKIESAKPTSLWFVLLVQNDDDAVMTENPKCECFHTEADALSFAKESAKGDDDSDASYHVMKTTHIVTQKRSVSVRVMRPRP